MKTQNDTEIEQFLKRSPIIPCFLISKNGGKIETTIDGFEKKSIPIEKIKENYFKSLYLENDEDFQLIIDKNISSQIEMHGNGSNFKYKLEDMKAKNLSDKTFVGEYKLYSFNIREEDLSFSKYYIDQFKNIAKSGSSNEEKAKKLDEIFQRIGYYIPKKIYIGGMLINHINTIKSRKTYNEIIELKSTFNKDVKIDGEYSNSKKSNLDNIFKSEKTEIIGGNYNAKNFEEWIKSININNANVIECANIITAKNILDFKLRKDLEVPLEIIEDKYLRRKKYIEYIEEINDINLGFYQGNFDLIKGKVKETKEASEPEIYVKKFYIEEEPSFSITKIKFSQDFNDIIVGLKIIENRKDDYAGEWKFKDNPLGGKKISITFTSCYMRKQTFTIAVYLMKFPE